MAVLLIAEVARIDDGAAVNMDATAKAMTAAAAIGGDVHVLVAGEGVTGDDAATLQGAAKVLVADDAAYANGLAENLADLIVGMAGDYSHIVAPSTASAKNVLPRVAALLDVMVLSDVIGVDGPDTFERPIYAGNAIQTVKSSDAVKVDHGPHGEFRRRGDRRLGPGGDGLDGGGCRPLELRRGQGRRKSDRPELTGREDRHPAVGASAPSENFALVEKACRQARRGGRRAIRAAVDAGYAPNDWQVGQTGKVVAPELYVALGISGAIQHLAGMKDSKVIVAINKDEEAPIFQVADYGLVADLFEAVPEMTGKV